MSSVSGLNDKPHTAQRLPFNDPRTCFAFSIMTCCCLSFTSITDRTRSIFNPLSAPIATMARRSLGKQLPPNPAPALRYFEPIRGSAAMTRCTSITSAPSVSESLAISFIKEMRVASIALLAYLHNSDDLSLININTCGVGHNGAYIFLRTSTARSSLAPTTIRSGSIKSLTASPSLRNSGFEATAKSTVL